MRSRVLAPLRKGLISLPPTAEVLSLVAPQRIPTSWRGKEPATWVHQRRFSWLDRHRVVPSLHRSVCCHMPWFESGVGSTAVSGRGELPPRRREGGGREQCARSHSQETARGWEVGSGVMNRIQGRRNESQRAQPWTYGMLSLTQPSHDIGYWSSGVSPRGSINLSLPA